MKSSKLITALLVGAFALPAFAQSYGYAPRAYEERPVRVEAPAGDISRREARRIQRQQEELRIMRRAARADGVVTRSERYDIQRAQLRLDREIQRSRYDDRRY